MYTRPVSRYSLSGLVSLTASKASWERELFLWYTRNRRRHRVNTIIAPNSVSCKDRNMRETSSAPPWKRTVIRRGGVEGSVEVHETRDTYFFSCTHARARARASFVVNDGPHIIHVRVVYRLVASRVIKCAFYVHAMNYAFACVTYIRAGSRSNWYRKFLLQRGREALREPFGKLGKLDI